MLVELWPIFSPKPYPGNSRVNDDAVPAVAGLSRLWWLAVSFAMFASVAFSGCGFLGRARTCQSNDRPASRRRTPGNGLYFCGDGPW